MADFLHLVSQPGCGVDASPQDLALASIEKILLDCGSSLSTFNLVLDGDADVLNGVADRLLAESTVGVCNNNVIIDGVCIPPDHEMDALVASLNDGQRAIYEAVMSAVNSSSSVSVDGLFFVDGPGGSGKTHLFTIIAQKVLSAGKKVVSCAYTGLAASLLINGKTSHKVFTRELDISSTSMISMQSREAEALRACDIIMWDEITMTSKLQLGIADNLLKAVTGNYNVPMGGKVCVFGGDFRQGLPVPSRFGGRASVVDNTVLRSPVWSKVKRYTLRTCAPRPVRRNSDGGYCKLVSVCPPPYRTVL